LEQIINFFKLKKAELFNILIYNFIPIKVSFEDNIILSAKIKENINDMKDIFTNECFMFEKNSLLSIVCKYNNKWIIIDGFITDDGIRSLHYIPAILNKKNKIIEKNNDIFKISFINSCYFKELLLISTDKWNIYLNEIFNLFLKLKTMSSDEIINYFNINVKKQVEIIRLLLLGNKDNHNLAAVLYNTVKKNKYIKHDIYNLSYKYLNNFLNAYNSISKLPEKNKSNKLSNMKKLLISSASIPDYVKTIIC
jgi:hypothetical protein